MPTSRVLAVVGGPTLLALIWHEAAIATKLQSSDMLVSALVANLAGLLIVCSLSFRHLAIRYLAVVAGLTVVGLTTRFVWMLMVWSFGPAGVVLLVMAFSSYATCGWLRLRDTSPEPRDMVLAATALAYALALQNFGPP